MDTLAFAQRAGARNIGRRRSSAGSLVIAAVFIGGSVGTKTLGDSDFGIGESGRADDAIAEHFPEKGSESVLARAAMARAPTTRFRSVVDEVVARLERTRNVQNVSSPYARDNAGQLSEDGRSALVTFELPGDKPEDKVDLARRRQLDCRGASELRIEQFGDGSADKALSKAFEDDFRKAEVTSRRSRS